jgi:hypothetical protein
MQAPVNLFRKSINFSRSYQTVKLSKAPQMRSTKGALPNPPDPLTGISMIPSETHFPPIRGSGYETRAIALSFDQAFHARVKHVDVRYHFICELVDTKAIVLKRVPSAKNIADILVSCKQT